MIEGASTILVLFLLLIAASFASYLLSRWGVLRGADGTLAWAGIGLGALLLVTAVVIVAVAITLIPKLLSPVNDGRDEPMLRPAQSNGSLTPPHSSTEGALAPRRATATESAPVDSAHRRLQGESIAASSSVSRDDSNSTFGELSSLVDTKLRASVHAALGRGSGVVLGSAPWAATQCVVPVRRDPTDAVRWTIVNDCGAPVGILVAICMSDDGCSQRGTVAWQYPVDGMVLPAKYQRSVTQAEQTQYGQQLERAACIVTNPAAIRLIGLSAERRASAEWEIEFESVRNRDECLRNVRDLAAAGRHTGMPIGALLGDAMPAEVPNQGAQRF